MSSSNAPRAAGCCLMVVNNLEWPNKILLCTRTSTHVDENKDTQRHHLHITHLFYHAYSWFIFYILCVAVMYIYFRTSNGKKLTSVWQCGCHRPYVIHITHMPRFRAPSHRYHSAILLLVKACWTARPARQWSKGSVRGKFALWRNLGLRRDPRIS